ncbi:hypothetical protein [Chromobacterium subtsugae]|uniref:hypothetical protein n=1 Tax=Chromobacterium subtsugae TaxID=251747 RepID=UPI00069C3946|nr:hypothetical protein [Chromobacterium subtsugae]
MEQFLLALADTANVSAAAKKARISRRHMYRLRKDNEDLAAAWQEAIALGTAALEDEATRRAMEGTLKPVFYKGTKVGTIREYSDTLLIFLLKARAPEKYAERSKQEVSGSGGQPLAAPVFNVTFMDPMEAAKIYTDLMKS